MNPESLNDAIRAALMPRGSRILPFSDLRHKVLGPDPPELAEEALRAAVARMERRGEVVRVRGEKLSLIEFTDFAAGPLAVRGEKAFVLSGDRSVPDLPVPTGKLGSALDGDFVLARVEAQKPQRGARGRHAPASLGTVVKVLVRKRETVVGKIARGEDGTVIVPFDRKIDVVLHVPDGKDMDAPTGIYVEARITAYPSDRRLAMAEVIETIGFEGDPGVDVEVVARKWGIPRAFPQDVLDEADAESGEVPASERAARADYTGRVIVTIDGETARDFDDAVEAEPLPGGGYRVGVHIADVSHYVRERRRLDAEAFERGTSVYFPDRAIPMLPERLSNDLCSLRPDEEKRTVSAILTLDARGETVKAEFTRSLIRSRQRLTYAMVGRFLEGAGAEEAGIRAEVAPMLLHARGAAKLLRKRREARGSLDFDLPDADVILGETGDVVSIVQAVRNEAHRLIEELMLAANEAVAQHLELLPVPAVYRVHDRPDETRLSDIRLVLEPLGYDVPEDDEEITPAVFQRILEQAEGEPEERFVSELVLRAQKKALYSPDCRGHYALAAKYYCHFTSPIRRYPDLLVHRALTEWIATRRVPDEERAQAKERELDVAALQSSERERRAESAEREAVAWKKFVYLSKRIGEEFDAYVSAVVGFGLFVTLNEVFVDGLLPMEALGDDYFRYEEAEHRLVGASTGKTYRLGDRLRVKLVRADSERRMLDFRLVGGSFAPRVRPPARAAHPSAEPRARRPAPRGRSSRRPRR